jgi:hypothetical protein
MKPKATPPKPAPPNTPKKGATPPAGAYERYGLIGNPFRDLTSESLSDVEIFHVNLQVDEALNPIKEEVLAKENKAIVALIGNTGAGKTERLLLANSEGNQRGAFVVYVDVGDKAGGVVQSIAQKMADGAKLGGFARTFSPPPWYRAILPFTKTGPKGVDPVAAGKAIAEGLNARSPSFLLLNDLHNLSTVPEADAFARTLQELFDSLRPGVLVMFGSFPAYFAALGKKHVPLASRINQTFNLPTLTKEEAGLLIAKKLLAKRLVENLDPLYPFDREAIEALNSAAFGNPRRLIELADRAIDYAARQRAFRINVDLVRLSLPPKEPPGVAATLPIRPPEAAPLPVSAMKDLSPSGTEGASRLPAGTPLAPSEVVARAGNGLNGASRLRGSP